MEGATSSPAPAPVTGDLRTKYTRLAAEYSKLRSHFNVLKKGLLDEQAKSANLKEQLREKELTLRKSELEIDSLNFRNLQLTKRITVLQDDIEILQNKNSKKNKHKKDDRNPMPSVEVGTDSIIQEELQKKIMENAKLVSQIADKEFEISQLGARMSDAEKQSSDLEAKYKGEILKLKIQTQELTSNLESALNKEKINAANYGTPNKNFTPSNLMSTINGDFSSDVGSLIGSEDAISAEESLLSEQLKKKNDLLMNTEKENHALKIELDLLKLEIDGLKLNVGATSTEEIDSKNSSDASHSKNTAEELLGKLTMPFSIQKELSERERTLKNYFQDKISELIAEKQQFESMTRHYIDENDGLRVQIDYLKKEQHDLEDGLKGTQTTISKLEDELQSTMTNYDQQIQLLTEHVGNLNDTLVKQVEEIQHLKANKK